MTRQLMLGIVLIVAAFFCVAVMSAFGKAASGVSTATISFFQSFISLLLFLPWTLRHGVADLKTTQLPLNIARALAGLLSQVLYFWAVKEMTLIDAVLLVNAAPLFIPIVALIWNRTPITKAVGISLVVGFIGIGWAIASYFVIPTIVTENVGPIQALKRSATLIKKTWGETLTVQVGLSVVVFAAGLVAAALIAGGGALMPASPVLGGSVMALGFVWIFAAVLVGATLQAILTAALYLYAADGQVPRNFDSDLLKNAFVPK